MTGALQLSQLSIDEWNKQAESDLPAAIDSLQSTFGVVEPEIRAFADEENRFDRIRSDAGKLDAALQDTSPLTSVPIGVKDIFHVDELETGAGSKLPTEALRGVEAESVSILKRAGALIIGKTVSTEFAYFGPGPTRNPLDLNRTPGGSSSGSAAAVAAGLCSLALGTQTIGSISRPASFCGVVGYKPSYGRISTAGVIPLSNSLDHVGTFTANATDARTAAALLCHQWQRQESPRQPTLGIPEGPYLERASNESQTHFAHTCKALREHGFALRSVKALAEIESITETHYTIVAAEAARFHHRLFARYGDLYHEKTRQLVERGVAISNEELSSALESLEALRQELTDLMQTQDIDLWISPAAPGPAPEGLDSTGDPIMNLPWTHAGLPTLAIPSGLGPSGMPIGLQLAAGWWQDELLLEWGIMLEGAVQ